MWDNALLSNLNLDGNQPVMTLHFALQPGADRGTSIELPSLCWLISGQERAAMGVASYYHPEGVDAQQPGADPLDAPQRRKLGLSLPRK